MYNENFDELYEQFKPLMWSLIRDINVQGYDKDDLMQEMSMVLNECNRSFDPSKETKFSTYLYISLKTQIHKLLRHQGRLKRAELVFLRDDEIDVLEEETTSTNELELLLRNEALYNEIIEELREMPQGSITYLLLVEGKTMQAVGDFLGISKQRVSKVHMKNLKILKEKFANYSVDKL